MILKINEILGTEYDIVDQLSTDGCTCVVDSVEIIDDDGWVSVYVTGDPYNDGTIKDIFIHPESDSVWMIIECNGIHFGMYFADMARYKVIEHNPPKHIKDSTELSGGHLW